MNEVGRRDWESSPGEEEATYCEGREGEGDSGPAESDISACVKYLEAMLPVDDLRGASRAIAPYRCCTGDREPKRASSLRL